MEEGVAPRFELGQHQRLLLWTHDWSGFSVCEVSAKNLSTFADNIILYFFSIVLATILPSLIDVHSQTCKQLKCCEVKITIIS